MTIISLLLQVLSETPDYASDLELYMGPQPPNPNLQFPDDGFNNQQLQGLPSSFKDYLHNVQRECWFLYFICFKGFRKVLLQLFLALNIYYTIHS